MHPRRKWAALLASLLLMTTPAMFAEDLRNIRTGWDIPNSAVFALIRTREEP